MFHLTVTKILGAAPAQTEVCEIFSLESLLKKLQSRLHTGCECQIEPHIISLIITQEKSTQNIEL